MKRKFDIYYIGLFLLCFRSWFYFSNFLNINNALDNLIVLFIGLIFLFRIIINRYQKKELIIVIFLGIITFLSSYLSNEKAIFINIMAVLAAKNIDINKILKFILKFMLFF